MLRMAIRAKYFAFGNFFLYPFHAPTLFNCLGYRQLLFCRVFTMELQCGWMILGTAVALQSCFEVLIPISRKFSPFLCLSHYLFAIRLIMPVLVNCLACLTVWRPPSFALVLPVELVD